MAYTETETKTLVETYAAKPTQETVQELAVLLGKTTRSIVAKLSREGVYKKAERVATGSANRTSRGQELALVVEFAAGVEMPSLKKMTVKDLEALVAFIKREGQ